MLMALFLDAIGALDASPRDDLGTELLERHLGPVRATATIHHHALKPERP